MKFGATSMDQIQKVQQKKAQQNPTCLITVT